MPVICSVCKCEAISEMVHDIEGLFCQCPNDAEIMKFFQDASSIIRNGRAGLLTSGEVLEQLRRLRSGKDTNLDKTG